MSNLNEISVHSIAFNIIKNNMEYADALKNFCEFGKECVITINISPEEGDDGTWDAFNQWKTDNKANNLKLIKCNYSIKDPVWFGRLKNDALQNTTYNYKCLFDLDERVPIRDRNKWLYFGKMLQEYNESSFLIPSIDLYGDYYSLRWDDKNNFAFKWYLHLPGYFRGATNIAIREDGKINFKVSSTDELLDNNGNHIKCKYLLSRELSSSLFSREFNQGSLKKYLDFINNEGIFVFHLGYCDLAEKIRINKEIWQPYHTLWTGEDEDGLIKNFGDAFCPTYPHGLKLWNE